ncbi:hypothetical protein ILYODFUR_008987 [Ilyodon furcidens]|uniref:Uncharacterized protein n=1 Tax=Ilyodon furcidens TaxID=33524 RepID=A0ABV0USI8_9TELE
MRSHVLQRHFLGLHTSRPGYRGPTKGPGSRAGALLRPPGSRVLFTCSFTWNAHGLCLDMWICLHAIS